MAFQSMREMLSGCNAVSKRIVERNTVEWVDEEGSKHIRFHETDIVTIRKDGTQILTTGGWRTKTTKARLERYCCGNLYIKNRVWYLDHGGRTYVFEDGLTIHPDGRVSGAGNATKQQVLQKKIRTYSHLYAIALVQGKVGAPAGDCFLCMSGMDGDHLLSHMKEKYFVPTLVLNALNEMGASIALKEEVRSHMYKSKSHFFQDERYVLKEIAKYIDRYVSRKLGVE